MLNREDYLKEFAKDKNIVNLVKNNQLTKEDINNNFSVLLAYYLKKEKCKMCKKMDNCTQASKGYQPQLDYNGVQFNIDYIPCNLLQKELDKDALNNNLILMSCSFDNFNFSDIFINEKRTKVLGLIKSYISQKDLPEKGLYIHGRYGCGKTYLLAYLAKELAYRGHKVLFAYYPDLVRTLKSSIATGNLEDVVDRLKEVEILMLDDFGGEMLTSFIRDEVLGSILQDRMLNKRLTFISSNLDENLLFEHLKDTGREIDELRASRINERIKTLMTFVQLDDENHRK